MANGGVVGKINDTTNSSAQGIWRIDEAYDAVKNSKWPGLRIPPVTAGLIAVYDGQSWDGTKWADIYGSYNATTISGSVTTTSTTGNGATSTFTTLQGGTSAYINFPAGILPATYTIFHVTRTTGGTRRRIYTGTNNNWLSGFWGGGTGVAYHEGWLTGQPDLHGNNWFISTDQNSLYRSNGVTRGTSGGSASTNLSINNTGETTDWQAAFLAVYNTTLSSTDYAAVESWLASKYGITLG